VHSSGCIDHIESILIYIRPILVNFVDCCLLKLRVLIVFELVSKL
jgi:hypothetical protein